MEGSANTDFLLINLKVLIDRALEEAAYQRFPDVLGRTLREIVHFSLKVYETYTGTFWITLLTEEERKKVIVQHQYLTQQQHLIARRWKEHDTDVRKNTDPTKDADLFYQSNMK